MLRTIVSLSALALVAAAVLFAVRGTTEVTTASSGEACACGQCDVGCQCCADPDVDCDNCGCEACACTACATSSTLVFEGTAACCSMASEDGACCSKDATLASADGEAASCCAKGTCDACVAVAKLVSTDGEADACACGQCDVGCSCCSDPAVDCGDCECKACGCEACADAA